VVGWSSPKEGYDGMIEEARKLLQMHPDRKKSEEDAVTILRAHFPPFLLPLFKRFFAPLWGGRVAAVLCAWVTHLACQWLMGPSKVVAIEMEDGRKQRSEVNIEKCKFLDESKCAGSCIHTCKMPTQAFMFQDMGVPLLMEPNFENFSCEFKFGVHAPPRDTDPVLLTPCLATCPIRFPGPSGSTMRLGELRSSAKNVTLRSLASRDLVNQAISLSCDSRSLNATPVSRSNVVSVSASAIPPVTAASAAAVTAFQGTPVRTTSVLVVGATGTLGRQIVRKLLDDGFDVRCLVRPRPQPADFLRDWGATVVNGDLTRPETLPAALVGVHTVIDCATGRPEEPIRTVDWNGKVALIQSAQAMGVQRYLFFSIHESEQHPEVPLMEIKKCTEKLLEQSTLNYTTIRLCGFMQALIGQYAVPILEEQSVWGTDATTRIAYIDSQDVARMTMAALRNEKTYRKTITLAGPRAWTTQEVIALCERLAGQDAKVTTVPVGVLKLTRKFMQLFQWSSDVADRLAFSEVLTSNAVFSAPMTETYKLLGLDPKDTTTLEKYLQEYYTQILRKLKDLKATSKQGDYYL
ncbi:unnamed protein product, partial [Closterium sp. Naga37s-1]